MCAHLSAAKHDPQHVSLDNLLEIVIGAVQERCELVGIRPSVIYPMGGQACVIFLSLSLHFQAMNQYRMNCDSIFHSMLTYQLIKYHPPHSAHRHPQHTKYQ